MKISTLCLLITLCICFGCTSEDDNTSPENTNNSIYFPPLNSNEWQTTAMADLNWSTNKLQPLLDFLEEKNTKSFIVLHNGKIVLESYMNGHDDTKPWYWASAGKTLTTAIFGIAQNEGIININNKVSDYLGEGWTSAPLEKENLITCKNLLSMDSGLDDTVLGMEASNLQYIADAGSRWAYHGVFFKLQDAITNTSNISWSNYFNTNLRDKIGMTGQWLKSDNSNVYWSNARSMARFGLMTFAQGKWEDNQIVPLNFINEATNTSQGINEAYGYMWWLNGKSTYHLPQTQVKFNGKLIPNAPDDMFAGLGKNDQKLYIVPSKKLIIVRMGNSANDSNFGLSTFDNDLWEKINAVIN